MNSAQCIVPYFNVQRLNQNYALSTIHYALKLFPGDHNARATPDNIPNSEVKPHRADDTTRGTGWESRLLPGLSKPRSSRSGVSSIMAAFYQAVLFILN